MSKEVKNEFSELGPISGGNLFENKIKLEVSDSLAKNNIVDINRIKESISSELNKYFSRRTITPYFLLQLQANYFANTIKFQCNDLDISNHTIQIIRNSFINGSSGLVMEGDRIYPVNIVKVTKNIYSEIIEIQWTSIANSLISQTQLNSEKNNVKIVRGEKCKNVIIFNWGTMGYSAWVIIWPYIQQQSDLLKMVTSQMFSYMKKYSYKVTDPRTITTEMEMFFDPSNIFLMASTLGNNDFMNRIEVLDLKGTNGIMDMVEYYNEITKVYYSLYGRRVNTEMKEQANITDEVEAGQEQYDTLQKDWINQFKLFALRVNQLRPNTFKFDKKKDKEKEEESESDGDDD